MVRKETGKIYRFLLRCGSATYQNVGWFPKANKAELAGALKH